jgi:hypothetical protein
MLGDSNPEGTMSKTAADRRSERQQTLGVLDQVKGRHTYLADSLTLLTPLGAALEAAEPGVGFKDADFHDSVANRKSAAQAVAPLLVSVRKQVTVAVTGADATRAAAHYLLNGESDPRSFAAKEASLKFLIGALTGRTETWATEAKTKAEGLLHDLQASTIERTTTKTGTDEARAAYAKAAAEWDTKYQAVSHLVSAAGLLLGDAALHDVIIWTHPRHHAAPEADPTPAPAPK